MKPQVIVADDHRLVAEGVVKILEKEYSVVATPTDGRGFIDAVEKFRPDLALVDISLPLLNGLDACRHVKKSFPEVKIIILTMHSEQHFVNDAFRVGVEGYVLKTSVADELLFAAKEVLKGRTYISPVVAQGLVNQALDSSTEPPRRPNPDRDAKFPTAGSLATGGRRQIQQGNRVHDQRDSENDRVSQGQNLEGTRCPYHGRTDETRHHPRAHCPP